MSGPDSSDPNRQALTPDAAQPDSRPVEHDPTSTLSTRISLRLDLGQGRRLGPGKVRLLEAIRRQGSIAKAGREFAMSYRRAWRLVDELNRMFAAPLVATRGGGQGGGGAVLTPAGERVVALYRAVERRTQEGAAAELEALEAALAPEPDALGAKAPDAATAPS